jgi:hypothetical protein
VALDCEMVEVLCADGRLRDAAASVCVVDEYERVLLFSLVRPAGPVTDYRTDYTGVWLSCVCVCVCAVWFWVATRRFYASAHASHALTRAAPGLVAGDLDNAPPLEGVRAAVAAILAGEDAAGRAAAGGGAPVPRVLVGHGLDNDLSVLHLSHPGPLLRDTALHAPLQRATTGKAHKLRDLVAVHLGYAIQAPGAAHDPEVDAVGAMRLYRRVKGLAARHGAQAARDAAALARAGGGGGYAAAARGAGGGGAAASEGVAEGLGELCLASAARRTPVCWCLDDAPSACAAGSGLAASSAGAAPPLRAVTNVA